MTELNKKEFLKIYNEKEDEAKLGWGGACSKCKTTIFGNET